MATPCTWEGNTSGQGAQCVPEVPKQVTSAEQHASWLLAAALLELVIAKTTTCPTVWAQFQFMFGLPTLVINQPFKISWFG